jgi:hypothetical protein
VNNAQIKRPVSSYRQAPLTGLKTIRRKKREFLAPGSVCVWACNILQNLNHLQNRPKISDLRATATDFDLPDGPGFVVAVARWPACSIPETPIVHFSAVEDSEKVWRGTGRLWNSLL